MNQLSDQSRAQMRKCPKNHELVKTNSVSKNRDFHLSEKHDWSETAHIFCDICKTKIYYLANKTSKDPFYTCEECSFDVCKDCFT